LRPKGSKKPPKIKLIIYDLKKATVRQAVVFKPKEFENKSSVNPKAKATAINEILLVFTGNVNMKTKHM
jgi:hypothetical protein|tara:strand:- start:463 stop:669 length:207 start_codon:yes stop_codon:yes gene_type:complete